MSPQNIVQPLDPRSSYIYCPTCIRNDVRVVLTRDMFQFKCQFSHQFTYGELMAMSERGELIEMIKTRIIEQPADTDVKREIWIHPTLWERLNQKLEGRLLITLRTVFAALADDSIIFIEGPEVKELRLQGVKTGKDILAMLRNAKEMEQTVATLQRQLDLLAPILNAAGLKAAD
jgi:hypothetical protein